MSPQPILLCERTSVWTDALRGAFSPAGAEMPRIIEFRSVAELKSRLLERRREGRPTGFPAVEIVAENPQAACDFLAWHAAEGGDSPAVALLTSGETYGPLETVGALAREAGATLVIDSIRRIDEVVDVYLRYVADPNRHRAPSTAEQPSVADQIRRSLPWRDGDD